eukprot:m.223550 g.223550  ORF g.223550 m.223550 type:complete len:74 (-) comp26346_c0_seq26:252-473(-)
MLLYEFYFVQTIAQIPPCFLALPGSKNTKEVSTEMHQPCAMWVLIDCREIHTQADERIIYHFQHFSNSDKCLH